MVLNLDVDSNFLEQRVQNDLYNKFILVEFRLKYWKKYIPNHKSIVQVLHLIVYGLHENIIRFHKAFGPLVVLIQLEKVGIKAFF